jgi:hypothetical protein
MDLEVNRPDSESRRLWENPRWTPRVSVSQDFPQGLGHLKVKLPVRLWLQDKHNRSHRVNLNLKVSHASDRLRLRISSPVNLDLNLRALELENRIGRARLGSDRDRGRDRRVELDRLPLVRGVLHLVQRDLRLQREELQRQVRARAGRLIGR